MWELRDATTADCEPLFWRLSPEDQRAYLDQEKLPIAQMQWLVLDSAWVKVLDYGDGPVAIFGAIPLGKSQKGLTWFHSTPMADSHPYRLAKALKMAILELLEVFPHGLCGVLADPKGERLLRWVGFDMKPQIELAGRTVTPMELV